MHGRYVLNRQNRKGRVLEARRGEDVVWSRGRASQECADQEHKGCSAENLACRRNGQQDRHRTSRFHRSVR